MYEIKCNVCRSKITSFSVSCDHVSFRTDYKITGDRILKEDREYFTGHATNIIFTCPKCGEVVTKVEESPDIIDFGKNIESDMIIIDGNLIKQGYVKSDILKT